MRKNEIMDPNKKMMLMFRIKDHEIINLQNTLNFLSERQQRLTIDSNSQQNYQEFIDSTPSIIEKRDCLLKELEDIAKLKFEESNYTDMTANMCLYLINKQRQVEDLTNQLQDQYIESKYGKRFLFAELAKNESLPTNLAEMKPKYRTLRNELDRLTKKINETEAVKNDTIKELEDIRKINRDSEKSVPETARNMLYSVKECDKQLSEISRKAQKKQIEYNDKKSQYDKRISLINEIINDLKGEMSKQTNDPSQEICKELKLILENINGENQSSKFIKSRIDALLKFIAIPKRKQEDKLFLQQPQSQLKSSSPDIKTQTQKDNQQKDQFFQRQPLTPQMIKDFPLIITPQDEIVLPKPFLTPNQVKTRQNTTSQSVKDLKEKFRILKQQNNQMPNYFCTPNVKSPE